MGVLVAFLILFGLLGVCYLARRLAKKRVRMKQTRGARRLKDESFAVDCVDSVEQRESRESGEKEEGVDVDSVELTGAAMKL